MKKKIAAAVLILLFISAMAGTVIKYKFLNNNSQDNTCFMAPNKKGCFEKLFDELISKLLVYNVKYKEGKSNKILLEKNFSRIVDEILFNKTDILLGWGISKDIEFEQNFSLVYNKLSYGFDCGINSIKINSLKCKFQNECIGSDKYIRKSLGQVSSKKIHNFEDKLKELKLEDKKIFVKLSFALDGEYEVLDDILKHSDQITGIIIALQLRDSEQILKALEMVDKLNKDFVLISRNPSNLHKNDKNKYGTYINTPSYKGYLGYNLFFLVYANKNLLSDYSISLNQNDNLIYFLNETKKARYEKGQIKFSKTRNARKLNMSPGKVKFKTVLKEKLKESTLK